jgi:hypothetical protein
VGIRTCAAAGTLLAPLEEAITARSRDSWHLHAGETSWHVFSPGEGDGGPAKWRLWVFTGPDTTRVAGLGCGLIRRRAAGRPGRDADRGTTMDHCCG